MGAFGQSAALHPNDRAFLFVFHFLLTLSISNTADVTAKVWKSLLQKEQQSHHALVADRRLRNKQQKRFLMQESCVCEGDLHGSLRAAANDGDLQASNAVSQRGQCRGLGLEWRVVDPWHVLRWIFLFLHLLGILPCLMLTAHIGQGGTHEGRAEECFNDRASQGQAFSFAHINRPDCVVQCNCISD